MDVLCLGEGFKGSVAVDVGVGVGGGCCCSVITSFDRQGEARRYTGGEAAAVWGSRGHHFVGGLYE